MPPVVFSTSPQFERALACQIILLAPIAPHFASELWSGFLSAPNRINTTEEIKWEKDVLEQNWPRIDSNYNMDITCQVIGSCVVLRILFLVVTSFRLMEKKYVPLKFLKINWTN